METQGQRVCAKSVAPGVSCIDRICIAETFGQSTIHWPERLTTFDTNEEFLIVLREAGGGDATRMERNSYFSKLSMIQDVP